MSIRENSLSTSTSLSIPSTSTQGSSNTPIESPIEQFITDMLTAVSEDSTFCGNCELNNPSYSKCLDCNENLCDTCVGAHQRVRMTKDHRIHRNNVPITGSHSPPQPSTSAGPSRMMASGHSAGHSQASSAGSPSTSTSSDIVTQILASTTSSHRAPGPSGNVRGPFGSPPPVTDPPLCPRHNSPHRLYCKTCVAPLCNSCYAFGHQGHSLTYIEEGLQGARETSTKLTGETRQATLALREALDNVQRMSERVEIKAFTTATEVRNVMRKYIAAFEARELELLRRIDQGRQIKLKMLSTQMENLRLIYTRLARATDFLNECSKSANNFEILAANQQVHKELKQARSLGSNLLPCEDDGFMFLPPNDTCLSAINTLGKLKISSSACSPPGAFGGFKEPQLYLPSTVSDVSIANAKSRPIYGANNVITVKDMGPNPSLLFGVEGERDGELCRPWGVIQNRFGQFVVADRSNNRIQVFDSKGKFLFKFGSQGTGPSQFDRPAGVAINPQDDIIVADKDNHRIQVFKKDGTYLLTFGEKGSQIGQFQYPWDVACDSMGNILVSDTRNHRVQLFNWNGIFIAKYGFEGPTNMWKHFDSPRGVCFHPSGEIIVTDFNNHRLVLIDPALTRARYIGEEGSDFGQFNRPQGVVCDDRGNMIISDSRNNRIQVFNDKGEFLWALGQLGKGFGDMDRPSGICLTLDGRISVVDFGNNRVQMF